MKRHVWATLALLAVVTFPSATWAQRMRGNQPGIGGMVNLPFMINDNAGTIWRIYPGGWMQQQGNMPSYSQGAMLMVNGAQLNENTPTARLDDKTGELIVDNVNGNGISAQRRILFDKAEGMLRYIDILKNTQPQDQTFNVMVQSSLNFGLNSSQLIPDPKKKDQNIAWIAQTGAGNCVVEVYAGKGAKLAPTINAPQGNNFVQAAFSLTIPAGKEVAIMHLHRTAPNQEAGVQFVNAIKETALLKSVPVAIRKLIVNFPTGQGWIGETEMLRGDLLDVVELRTGDQFKGTLKETAYSLQTFYGPISLPVDQVIGMLSAGQFRPRQLLITSDGQIFGGHLTKETIDIQLSSGQNIQIPLGQVSRLGYRKRLGEPEEWTFDKPLVLLRSGERIAIKLPGLPIEVVTRYGKVSLQPQSVAAVLFQGDESNVHQVLLTDGSKISGLLTAEAFDLTLSTGQAVKLPVSAIARLQLTPKLPDADDLAPSLRLAGDDTLVGMLTGKLNLDTAFDTIQIMASEIKNLSRTKESVQDVQLSLWDGTTLSGQLHEADLECQLKSGAVMKVPVALVDQYTQPQPQPSASMLEKIKAIVADLNSDDWKSRDRAQAALISMGPVAESVLKQLRAGQPPETQKTIDLVMEKLAEQRKKDKTPPIVVPPGGELP